MKIIDGDILDQRGIICHQTNCRHVCGAGLALQIAKKYPAWEEMFKQQSSAVASLGHVWVYGYPPLHDPPRQIIASLYAQDDYGRQKGRCYTDYDSFGSCLKELFLWRQSVGLQEMPVYFPWGIGCGLAGGDWMIIKTYLEIYFPDCTVVQLPNKPAESKESDESR